MEYEEAALLVWLPYHINKYQIARLRNEVTIGMTGNQYRYQNTQKKDEEQ